VRRILTENMVTTSFRCVPQLGLIYLYNPKVACTTIQYSLWAGAEAQLGIKSKRIQPHRRAAGPIVANILEHPIFGSTELRAMTCFSVVRNPFLRILSGYLNKIVNQKPVWKRFATEHGIDPAAENHITFTDFLRIIETDCDETINPHFQPQYLNLLLPFSRPNFIGRLENFAEVESFLSERGVATIERKGVATNTSARLHEFYTEEGEAIVARKFADDFRLFGYSPRLADARTLFEPHWHAETTDLLMDWLAGHNFPADHIEPPLQAYRQFQAEKDHSKRVEMARVNFPADDNTERLAAYARKAQQYGDAPLATAINKRIYDLKNDWRARVQNDKCFASARKTEGTAADRRARRLERRAAKAQPAGRAET